MSYSKNYIWNHWQEFTPNTDDEAAEYERLVERKAKEEEIKLTRRNKHNKQTCQNAGGSKKQR